MKNNLKYIAIRIIYHFSKEKRELDTFIKRIRRAQPLSEKEWSRFHELAEKEDHLIRPGRMGFEHIMFNGKTIPDEKTIVPPSVSSESIFSKKP